MDCANLKNLTVNQDRKLKDIKDRKQKIN